MMMINDGLQSSQEVWMITLLLFYPIFYFIMQKIIILNRAKQKRQCLWEELANDNWELMFLHNLNPT